MMRRAAFANSAVKEARALLPTWAGSVVLIAAASVVLPDWPTVARLSVALSAIVLAAMSIGHEYVYGTLPVLLTMPATRQRHLANKLTALVPMLATLAVLAFLVLPADPGFDRSPSLPRLSLLFAVLTAPFFTMLCRGPIGGVVFAFGFAGGMQSLATTGWHQGVLIAASGVGVVGGWWLFMRLEVIESGSASLDLPDWFSMAPPKGAPYGAVSRTWLLVQKELRLQQMTVVTTASYLFVWTVVTITWWGGSEARGILAVMGIICGGLLAVLIGALAGAEERHLGTLEWQVLLPIPAWTQWAVKVWVATVLSLVLGFVMPVVMARGEVGFDLTPAAGIVVLTIGSLYVATLCESSIGAMITAAPVMFVLGSAAVSWFAPAILGGVQSWPLKIAILLLLVLALRFGYRNYVTAGRDLGRLGWQVVSMLAILVVVGSMYYAGQVRY